jgi:hypothetical protein
MLILVSLSVGLYGGPGRHVITRMCHNFKEFSLLRVEDLQSLAHTENISALPIILQTYQHDGCFVLSVMC